jgi:RHH-type proline utilization regulon transcriptional repressor/proline dehydrogenase/delta 1-pyrroline-5-carboxylate dehydrogenase
MSAAVPPRPLDDEQVLEQTTQRIGRQLFELSDFHSPAWWTPAALREAFLQRFIADASVKMAALRFVDVFPAISRDKAQIAAHVEEYFGEMLRDFPEAPQAAAGAKALSARTIKQSLELVSRMAAGPKIFRGPLAFGARFAIRSMARQFIGGATLEQVAKTCRRLEKEGCQFTLDLLGEAVISKGEAEEFLARYHEALARLDDLMGPGWERDPIAGPRVNISIKLTALTDHFDPIDPDAISRDVRHALRPLLRHARERGAFVNVDMEKFSYRDLTFRIMRDIMMEDEFRDWEDLGIVHQAYLKDADVCLASWLDFLKKRGAGMTIRLVKGAYWDSEQIWANQKSWPVPVIVGKSRADAMHERCARLLLDHHKIARAAIASHNIRSLAHSVAYAELTGVPADRFETQMLHGMGDPIRKALRDLGVPVRVYTPCGELISGIAYLVRRLLENTSQENFLMQKGTGLRKVEELLARPA